MLNDQIDITGPKAVDIQIRADKKVIWVNVDGVCRLRCCQIQHLTIDDASKQNTCAKVAAVLSKIKAVQMKSLEAANITVPVFLTEQEAEEFLVTLEGHVREINMILDPNS